MTIVTKSVWSLVLASIALVGTGREAHAQATANDGTGLTLGVYLYSTQYGPKISGLMFGTSADQAGLLRDDFINGIYSGGVVYPTHSLEQLRHAKLAVGPNQLAIVRLYRPNYGYIYPYLTFTADQGTAAFMKKGSGGIANPGPKQGLWKKQTIESKQLFEKALKGGVGQNVNDKFTPKPSFPHSHIHGQHHGPVNPEDLFNQGQHGHPQFGQIPPLN